MTKNRFCGLMEKQFGADDTFGEELRLIGANGFIYSASQFSGLSIIEKGELHFDQWAGAWNPAGACPCALEKVKNRSEIHISGDSFKRKGPANCEW